MPNHARSSKRRGPIAAQARPSLVLLILLCVSLSVSAQQRPAAPPFTILLTNDDGYDAPGLRALEAGLQPLGEIYVSAPVIDESGKSHSIASTREPILVTEHKQAGASGATWYSVEAPPATCVRLAVEALLPRRPDVVISGINRGENLGVVVYYSGTLGAAREAAIAGLPAIAVSVHGNDDKDYAAAAGFIRQLVEELRAKQMVVPGLFLNVNVPAGGWKGVRVTRLSLASLEESFERRSNPAGRPYFWSAYRQLTDEEEDTDAGTFYHGYVTLTPMELDVTSTPALDTLRTLPLAAPAAVPR